MPGRCPHLPARTTLFGTPPNGWDLSPWMPRLKRGKTEGKLAHEECPARRRRVHICRLALMRRIEIATLWRPRAKMAEPLAEAARVLPYPNLSRAECGRSQPRPPPTVSVRTCRNRIAPHSPFIPRARQMSTSAGSHRWCRFEIATLRKSRAKMAEPLAEAARVLPYPSLSRAEGGRSQPHPPVADSVRTCRNRLIASVTVHGES